MKKVNIKQVGIFLGLVAFFYIWTMVVSSFGQDPLIALGYFIKPKALILNLVPVFFVCLLIFALSGRYSYGFFASMTFFSLIAIGHAFKMNLRGEGLKIIDYELIIPAFRIMPQYINIKALPIVAFVGLLTYLTYRQAKKFAPYKMGPWTRVLSLIGVGLLSYYLVPPVYFDKDLYMGFSAKEDLDLYIEVEGFKAHGLPYSLLYNAQYLELNKYYSPKKARKVLGKYKNGKISQDKEVNIILYQLEGFKDFSDFREEDFLIDPYRYWREIENRSIKGSLVVDVYGGGTIDTEVKVATGNQEIPRFTLPRESVARFLGEEGYYTFFAHGNTGKFYNREKLYSKMAYHDLYFKDIEGDYMREEELISHMRKKIEAQRGPVFAHLVGIENHGPFGKDLIHDRVYCPMTNDQAGRVNNYFYGLEDSTRALLSYIEDLEKKDKAYILVAYGDHSPNFSMEDYQALGIKSGLSEEEEFQLRFETPYIVYGNQAAKDKLGKDFDGSFGKMGPGFLMPRVLTYLGYGGGTKGMAHMVDFGKNYLSYIGEFYLMDKEGYRPRTSQDEELIREFENINLYRAKRPYENRQ